MDIGKEIQKVREDLEKKQLSLAGQLRAEFNRFSGQTQLILNSIDDKIAEKVREEVQLAFSEIKNLIVNTRIKTGA